MINKKIFSIILLLSFINSSYAFDSSQYIDNDVFKGIELLDDQVKLIRNELTLQSTKHVEVEDLSPLQEDLIAEKELLKNRMEFYRELEAKVSILCSPPSIFKFNANKAVKRN